MTKRRAWLIVRSAVPAIVLTFVFWTVDWRKVASVLAGANALLLLAALALYHLAVFLQGWRWHVLLSSDGQRRPFWRLQTIHYAAMFFDIFTPGKLGSDAYRLAAFRDDGKLPHLITSLLALRIQGLTASCAMAAVTGGILLGRSYGGFITGAAVIPVLLIAAILAYASLQFGRAGLRFLREREGLLQRVGQYLDQALFVFKGMMAQPRAVGLAFALSFLYLFTVAANYAVVGRSFRIDMPPWEYLLVVPILLVASTVPITIQGRGVTEGLALLLWGGRSASAEQIVLMCLAVYAVGLTQGLLGGLVWLGIRSWRPVTPADAKQAEVGSAVSRAHQ